MPEDTPLAKNEQHADQPPAALPIWNPLQGLEPVKSGLKTTQLEPAASSDDNGGTPKSVMEAYHLGDTILNTDSVQSLVVAEQRAQAMIAEAKREMRDAKPNAVVNPRYRL